MSEKTIKVDLLYLDKSACERCQLTVENLHLAIDEFLMLPIATDVKLHVNEVLIDSEEKAINYQLISSPTIRINGLDIQSNLIETDCTDCGDLCGDQTDCRSWVYQGELYDSPPIGLLLEALTKELAAPKKLFPTTTNFELPENLKRFFAGKDSLQKGCAMKPRVAFVCVHNSCRSQMAEALSKLYASDVFEAVSAGTETKPQINQDAVRIIKDRYGVDMNETQHSKLLTDIPEVDIVVTMGCNVICPYVPSRHQEDWGLDDPTGHPDEAFIETATTIEQKVKDLAKRIEYGQI